jgi:hypothetical protein
LPVAKICAFDTVERFGKNE